MSLTKFIINRCQEAQNDLRTTKELIGLALTENDEDAAWEAVTVLHFRGNREVFEAARKLCESGNSKERKLAADILGQLGIPDRTFPDESLAVLFKLLDNDTNIDVLNAVGVALGHINDPRAIEPLVRLKKHPSEDVRYGVVFGLLGHENELAIKALIELSSDENEDVRNWATFGLGSQINTDTKEIREALWQRIDDNNDEIRGEALVGLAIRRDERVVSHLIEELSSECVGLLAIEAAKEIGNTKLYPALMQLKKWWEVNDDLLEEAISSCKGEPEGK